MLVWLASYPRSGNTFTRVILNEVFGIKTRSLSGDGDDRVFSVNSKVLDAVGHLKSESRGFELIQEARQSSDIYVVKTHEPPLTDDPAIYIVRDGRAAVVSYFHYLNDIENALVSLESVIDGKVYAGSWSDHFAAWRPIERPGTLVLRFEDITRDPSVMIDRLGDFISVKPRATRLRTFDDLHNLYPKFFRKGDDVSNIREISAHLPRFIQLHGALMQRLGYRIDSDN